MIRCPGCDGWGLLLDDPEQPVCPQCKGVGRVLRIYHTCPKCKGKGTGATTVTLCTACRGRGYTVEVEPFTSTPREIDVASLEEYLLRLRVGTVPLDDDASGYLAGVIAGILSGPNGGETLRHVISSHRGHLLIAPDGIWHVTDDTAALIQPYADEQ